MTGQPGVVYMLHFSRPYRHARHYVGWTEDLLDRLDAHATGRGARLVEVITQAGIGFTVVRICEGTRDTERAIKNDGGAVRFCPVCTLRPWTGRWSAITPEFIPRTFPSLPGRRYLSCLLTLAAQAATRATTPTSSMTCSAVSTTPPQARPGGAAPNWPSSSRSLSRCGGSPS